MVEAISQGFDKNYMIMKIKKSVKHQLENKFAELGSKVKIPIKITKSPARENPRYCPMCKFFNSQPIILPCKHLLCRRCLLEMVKKVMNKT